MEPDKGVGHEAFMAQIGVAERPGHQEPWVFGLSRTGGAYEYDADRRGWHPLKSTIPGMVLIQIAVAPQPGGAKPAVFGVTEAGNTMQYNFRGEAWWPLERQVLDNGRTRTAAGMPVGSPAHPA